MTKKVYFQYQKELKIPAYVAYSSEAFDLGLEILLTKMKFTKLAGKEEDVAILELKKNSKARCLNLIEATPAVAQQFLRPLESDRYGEEALIPKSGHQVYRYKGVGIMLYALSVREWELGTLRNFGGYAAKVILNRYLTWALTPHGFLGLWGVPVEDGLVLQRPIEANGEVVFVDIFNHQMASIDGVKKMSSVFKILKLDPTLRGRNVRMSQEELLSVLAAYSSYLDFMGLPVPVRQMIQRLSKVAIGFHHPEESFRPRTDLSL